MWWELLLLAMVLPCSHRAAFAGALQHPAYSTGLGASAEKLLCFIAVLFVLCCYEALVSCLSPPLFSQWLLFPSLSHLQLLLFFFSPAWLPLLVLPTEVDILRQGSDAWVSWWKVVQGGSISVSKLLFGAC